MLLTELFPKWYVLMVTTIKMAFEILQDVVFPLIYFYYISKNWRYLHYAYGLLFTLPVPFLCMWLPESPHFLYERARIKETHEVLQWIAKVNGKEMGEYDLEFEKQEKDEMSPYDFLIHPVIWSNFMIAIFIFCLCTFDTFLLGYYVKYIGGNIFGSIVVLVVASVCGWLCASMVKRIKIKTGFLIGFAI